MPGPRSGVNRHGFSPRARLYHLPPPGRHHTYSGEQADRAWHAAEARCTALFSGRTAWSDRRACTPSAKEYDHTMPVIRTTEQSLGPDNRPAWSGVTSAGIFSVSVPNGRFDCHYHDCDEYWLVFGGKARVMTEGAEYYVKRGDIVCTRAGDEHDVVEVYEELQAFWFEDTTAEGGRVGHLHRDESKAAGHPVPVLPVPEDFPE
ncbi:MAG: cupin domain-containing protein [Chitinivibrionales bacterium]|nr:cupin domain-containing protein [Chitinivibrionales bacterium]